MDQFFQQLRKIQKKERSNGTLARVEDSFYKDIHKYLDELRTHIGNDPFAAEQYLLKDTQRIATEICERREHKITDAAVVNIHRSYHLFAGKPQFDLIDTTPLNLTPEEEKFYFSLIDTLTNHRKAFHLKNYLLMMILQVKLMFLLKKPQNLRSILWMMKLKVPGMMQF